MAKAKSNNKKGGGKSAGGGGGGGRGAGPREMLIVGSKVRGMIKDADCNTAGDALDGLNEWLYFLIQQATQRAKSNGRKTVRAHDFMVTP